MPERKSEDSAQFRRILTRNLALPLAMGLGSVVVFVAMLWHVVGMLNWVDHTHRTVAKGQELTALAAEQESGMRGFALSGAESFLTPYSLAQARFQTELDLAQSMVRDNPMQRDRLRRVGALWQRWNLFAQGVIDQRRRGEAVEQAIRTETGKQLFDEMRRELRAFMDNEARLLRDRNVEAQNATWLAVGGFIVLLLAASGLIAWMGQRDIRTLSEQYGEAMARMRKSARESEERSWLRGAQLDLSTQLAGELAARGIGERTLSFLAERVGAVVSAAFVRGEDGHLQRIESHGLQGDGDGPAPDPEQGLVGQVWRDGRLIRVPGLQADFLKVATSLGDMPPQEIVLVPAVNDRLVNGVLELGFMQPPAERTLALLEQLQEPLGAMLEAAHYRQRLQRSLEETRQLNEEMQVQQEELRTDRKSVV